MWQRLCSSPCSVSPSVSEAQADTRICFWDKRTAQSCTAHCLDNADIMISGVLCARDTQGHDVPGSC